MNEVIHKPVLIIIAGSNGSGKTSVTSRILHHKWLEDSIYINPDIIAQEKFGDWNSREAIMQAVKYSEELSMYGVSNNQCFAHCQQSYGRCA